MFTKLSLYNIFITKCRHCEQYYSHHDVYQHEIYTTLLDGGWWGIACVGFNIPLLQVGHHLLSFTIHVLCACIPWQLQPNASDSEMTGPNIKGCEKFDLSQQMKHSSDMI